MYVKQIDWIVGFNLFFLGLLGVFMYSLPADGEMAEGFGMLFALILVVWHLAIFISALVKSSVENAEDYEGTNSHGRLFILTFFPWVSFILMLIF
jgi:hypothetical protein